MNVLNGGMAYRYMSFQNSKSWASFDFICFGSFICINDARQAFIMIIIMTPFRMYKILLPTQPFFQDDVKAIWAGWVFLMVLLHDSSDFCCGLHTSSYLVDFYDKAESCCRIITFYMLLGIFPWLTYVSIGQNIQCSSWQGWKPYMRLKHRYVITSHIFL